MQHGIVVAGDAARGFRLRFRFRFRIGRDAVNRVSTDYQNTVHVIRHHHPGVQLGVRETIRDFLPILMGQRPNGR